MITILIRCDRCGAEVDKVEASLLDLVHGRERSRKPLDLCSECNRKLMVWLDERRGK
ncbi:MAG: hypothetical protein JOZ53_04600 [Planctomycetaceae bacterium]|nr:hypothetical protein [Planctomycetaceae bacterium]